MYVLRACLILLTLVVAAKYLGTLSFQGDTSAMLSEVDGLLAAVHGGRWSGWSGQFALLQKVSAILLKAQGLHAEASLAVLAFLNLAAFAASLSMAWQSLQRSGRRSAILFIAVVLSGPLLWYARSTFGEILAAFCTLGLVVACWERAQPWKLFMWFIAAGVSKDTILPFLIALAFLTTIVGREPSGNWITRPARTWLLITASTTTLFLNVTFNYLRFGSPFNLAYLDPTFLVPRWSTQVSFFLGVLFSPNGGLLFFWPAFVGWVLLAGFCAGRGALERGRGMPLVPWFTVTLVVLGLALGLAKWYAPLGWVCWGPRLLLPALPALMYLLTVYYGRDMQVLLSRHLLRRWLAGITGAALGLVALPNFAVLFKPNIVAMLFSSDATCPHDAVIQKNAEYYYYCMNHGLWTKRSILFEAYSQTNLRDDSLYAVLCSFLLAYLVSSASTKARFTLRDVRP